MTVIDYIRCPSCQSQAWVDKLALGDEEQGMRFQCTRCGKVLRLAGCSQCKGTGWKRLDNLFQGGSRKPVVRYKCLSCGRVVGLFLDHDR